MAFHKGVEEGNWQRTDLKNFKIKLVSWNECLKLGQPWNAHKSANTHWNWAKQPSKEAKSLKLSKNVKKGVIG